MDHVLYSPDHSTASPHRLSLASQLRQGIEDGELVLHYQPKLDLKTRQIHGLEALIRWQHPKEGLIAPADFLPLAEQAGLIRMIDLWALRSALLQAEIWRKDGLELDIAVNLAPESLQDGPVLDAIMALLQCSPQTSRGLTLEITERAVLADPVRARANLLRLRAMGVRVALDDFGTGYSSLAHLKALPVDELKIDHSFVKHLNAEKRDVCIVRSVIALGHDLGLCVVVEGVESAAVLELLDQWGADQVQGYYLTPPLAPDALLAWISDHARKVDAARILSLPPSPVAPKPTPARHEAQAPRPMSLRGLLLPVRQIHG